MGICKIWLRLRSNSFATNCAWVYWEQNSAQLKKILPKTDTQLIEILWMTLWSKTFEIWGW